jgi:hypothetical protein
VGFEGPDDTVYGDSIGCFPLDTGDVGTCCSVGECGLKIQESELSCNWGVLGKLASLSVAEVIARSADYSSLLTVVVSSSDLFSLSEVL